MIFLSSILYLLTQIYPVFSSLDLYSRTYKVAEYITNLDPYSRTYKVAEYITNLDQYSRTYKVAEYLTNLDPDALFLLYTVPGLSLGWLDQVPAAPPPGCWAGWVTPGMASPPPPPPPPPPQPPTPTGDIKKRR